MILFIFEGKEREPALFRTIKELYFSGSNNDILCSFGTDVYELYRRIVDEDKSEEEKDAFFFKDVVAVLKEMKKNDPASPLHQIENRSDVSEVYLFFDYDIHVDKNCLDPRELNKRINTLVRFFSDETEQGKMFISYPMVEAFRYVKSLPDPEFHTYEICLSDCGDFKSKSNDFSCYKNLDFACFRFHGKTKAISVSSLRRKDVLLKNWNEIKIQNIEKANYICYGEKEIPACTSLISQLLIFKTQLKSYYSRGMLSVLCSIPLFLFDYFGRI